MSYIEKNREQYNIGDDILVAYPTIPKTIALELTNKCNRKCSYCYNRLMQRPHIMMDKDFAFRIIEESFHIGCRDIGFHMVGEPLLHKDIVDIVKHAKEVGFDYTYLTTNGDLITKQLLLGLNRYLDSINISSHGRNMDIVAGICSDYIKNVYVSGIEEVSNQAGYMDGVPASKTPCPLLFNRIHVTCEGYMTLCCLDFENNMVVGDLNKDTICDVWYSKKFTELRKQHIDNKVTGQCLKCTKHE